MKERPGDQPLPEPNLLPVIQDLVMDDIERRKQLGIERYGTALQPHNGRDTLRDAYEEALDLAMYLRQAIWERDNPPRPSVEIHMTNRYRCSHPGCISAHTAPGEVCC